MTCFVIADGLKPCNKWVVRRDFAQIFTAILLAIAIGGHWAILQSLAWAGMIVNYAQTDSVREAFSKTFDGKHPCAVCKFVQHGTQNEKKPQAFKSMPKLDPMIQSDVPVFESRAPFPICSTDEPILLSRRYLPPIPPPRQA
jgi:hypothetical protein